MQCLIATFHVHSLRSITSRFNRILPTEQTHPVIYSDELALLTPARQAIHALLDCGPFVCIGGAVAASAGTVVGRHRNILAIATAARNTAMPPKYKNWPTECSSSSVQVLASRPWWRGRTLPGPSPQTASPLATVTGVCRYLQFARSFL
jgi:hypothetical protein